MDVFVDESGDLGFSEQSTKFFVVAYITCDNASRIRTDMKRTLRRLHEKKQYSYVHRELKFSRMNDYCRKYVLGKINSSNPRIGVVIVEKKFVSHKLRTDLTVLYNWTVVHNLMSALLPSIEAGQKLQIIFDKSLPKTRIESFNHYVSEKASYLFFEKGGKMPRGCISAYHVDSDREPCLQAVDAIAGAYFQLFEKKKDVYVNLIKNNISSYNYLWKK